VTRGLEVAGALGSTALIGFGVLPLLHRELPPEVWFAVRWPRDVESDAALSLLRHLAARHRPAVIVLEVRASRSGITHRIGTADRDAKDLQRTISSLLPGTLLEPADDDGREKIALARAVELRLTTRERSLRRDAPDEVARSLATALAAVGNGTVVLQWLIGPRLTPLHVGHGSAGLPSNLQLVRDALLGTAEPLDARAQAELRDKVGDHGFRATCRIATSVSDPASAERVLRQVVGALRVAEGPGAHFRTRPTKADLVTNAQAPRRWGMAINVGELVGLLAWPIGDARYPGIERIGSRRVPVPRLVPKTGRIVCDGNDPSTRRPLAQDVRDALMHTLLLGPTGTGKSTIIASLAVQEIAAGRGVVVVDPKTDLIDDILQRIPRDRLDDIVVLDASDDHPVGLNPLAGAGSSAELVVDQLMAVFRGLYTDLGPRSSDILHSGLRAIASSSSPTLCALPMLLTDERFRASVAKEATDAFGLQPFFTWFRSLSKAEASAVVAPAMNKLRPLVSRPALRGILGQTAPRFDMREVFTGRKVLLVSLGSGAIGPEAAQLLGSLVVSQIWFAAQTRSRVPPDKRTPVVAYLDEWHTLLHAPVDLADLLAQSRALGLGLVLANQSLSQLPPATRSAALANARSKVCFRLSAEDAAIMARTTDDLDAFDFQSLGRYEVYASLLADGRVTPYASGVTRELRPPSSDPDAIRRRSRDRYGVDRAETDAQLMDIGADKSATDDGKIGRRKRGLT
jgi:hypothetical protein